MYIHLYHNKTQKTKALTCWFGYGNVLTHHYVVYLFNRIIQF